uniref:Uncharacterized protein n=1 Tax=Acanthochromis polyacanthus TaxID=80966 RepID=A0A3Q1GQ12_9TELE
MPLLLKRLSLIKYSVISAAVRELLGITETLWSRSIADPPRDSVGLYLELKSRTGVQADRLTYQQFLDGSPIGCYIWLQSHQLPCTRENPQQ